MVYHNAIEKQASGLPFGDIAGAELRPTKPNVDNAAAAAEVISFATRLEADTDQMRRFAEALFRRCRGISGWVTLRAFEHETNGVALSEWAPFNGDLVKAAAEAATKVANQPFEQRAVFAPPVCIFKSSENAKSDNVACCPVISVELDERPKESLQTLEIALGPATLIVASGGVWTAPDGEEQEKLHAYWRLVSPAVSSEEQAVLKRVRKGAARLVGGDTTNNPLVHPIRWAGSWHTKARTPRLCRIIGGDDAQEIDLHDAHLKTQAALDTAGIEAVTTGRAASAENTDGPFSLGKAVLRQVMLRRPEWLPDVLPGLPVTSQEDRSEWRVSSEDLGRELEEDLSIYPDGIHDHGTERTHDPISLIREFGAIDEKGEIAFGGCPDYGKREDEPYAVVGEPVPNVRRPTDAQALTWLCRRLAGENIAEFDEGATWDSGLPRVAAAIGLEWNEMESARFARTFEGDGPSVWGNEQIRKNSSYLAALQAVDPKHFTKVEFALEMRGQGEDLSGTIAESKARTVQAAKLLAPAAEVPVHENGAWPDPRDVFGDGDPRQLADVPRDALPPVLDEWARDVADRMGAPVAFTVGAALGTMAGAIGSKFRIQPKQFDTDWTEPAFLWFAIVEEPGGLKSPVISAATRPLAKADAECVAEDSQRHAAWAERKSKRRKGEPEAGPEPKIRRHVVEGFTMEALTGVLKDNKFGVLIRQDELTQLIGSLDAYKSNKGGDRPQLLSLIDGRETRVDRAGKGVTLVSTWGASVVGAIQPRKIQEMKGLDADGLLQRFMPITGDATKRTGVDRPPNRAAMEEYESLVREIARNEPVSPDAIKLGPAAREVWVPAGLRLAALADLPNLSPAWRGHLGKLPGFSNRLLLTLHVVETWRDSHGNPDRVEVSKATARRAVALLEWLISHSIRFYEQCVGAGETVDDAKWIAGHILSGGACERITRRQVGQARHELRSAPERVARAMAYLDQMSWCEPDESTRADRYGVSRWRVNPRIFSQFENRAATERERRRAERERIAAAVAERRRLESEQ